MPPTPCKPSPSFLISTSWNEFFHDLCSIQCSQQILSLWHLAGSALFLKNLNTFKELKVSQAQTDICCWNSTYTILYKESSRLLGYFHWQGSHYLSRQPISLRSLLTKLSILERLLPSLGERELFTDKAGYPYHPCILPTSSFCSRSSIKVCWMNKSVDERLDEFLIKASNSSV